MSNIHGLFGNKKDDDEDDNDDENNRFVGGISDRGGGSGLAVQPNMAEGGGPPPPGAAQDAIFGLAENAGSDSEDGPPRRTITMYRGGFVVDEDGPYRRLDDPANAEFLRSLARGQTPRELLEGTSSSDGGGGGGGNITVGLIDKRNTDYVEKFRSFAGAGNSLGSDAAVPTDGIVDPEALSSSSSSLEPPPLDEGQPTTSIQVRLMNGQRQVIRINLHHTVMDLALHVVSSSSSPSSGRFQMVSGFPPKPITDLTQSIETAGLKGAQVIQKGV